MLRKVSRFLSLSSRFSCAVPLLLALLLNDTRSPHCFRLFRSDSSQSLFSCSSLFKTQLLPPSSVLPNADRPKRWFNRGLLGCFTSHSTSLRGRFVPLDALARTCHRPSHLADAFPSFPPSFGSSTRSLGFSTTRARLEAARLAVSLPCSPSYFLHVRASLPNSKRLADLVRFHCDPPASSRPAFRHSFPAASRTL